MLTIGEFARLAGVSVRTLHHYEEVGLLIPASVSAKSGYRIYSAHQLPRLHRIIALKELGLSLAQLQPLVEDMSLDTLRGMLLMKRVELEASVNDDQTRLVRVEQRLRYIEQEDVMACEILLKEVSEMRVAAIEIDKPGLRFENFDDDWVGDMATAFFTLAERLEVAGMTGDGPAFSFYRMKPDGDLTAFVAVEIGNRELPGEDVIYLVLPPTIVAATVIDHGGALSHGAVGPIYGELARWAEDHGYDVAEPGRDLLISFEDGVIMEHQLPVTPANRTEVWRATAGRP